MPTQTLNGMTHSYDDVGRGRPLVLIHGFPGDRRMWAAQVGALSSVARVIAPDLPGFGQSHSTEPFTIETLAHDLHALLTRIDALPCMLGGFSMGGYVSIAFARKFPVDLIGLLLADSRAAEDDAAGKQARDAMVDLVRNAGTRAVTEAMLPKMLTPATLKHRPDVVQQARSIMNACPALTIEHALVATRDRDDYTSYLPSIPAPTQILVGDSDVITPPSMAEAMRQLIPCAVLTVIPEAGHLSPIEQPGKVSDAIREFFERVSEKGK